jgi:hypothetical protein
MTSRPTSTREKNRIWHEVGGRQRHHPQTFVSLSTYRLRGVMTAQLPRSGSTVARPDVTARLPHFLQVASGKVLEGATNLGVRRRDHWRIQPGDGCTANLRHDSRFKAPRATTRRRRRVITASRSVHPDDSKRPSDIGTMREGGNCGARKSRGGCEVSSAPNLKTSHSQDFGSRSTGSTNQNHECKRRRWGVRTMWSANKWRWQQQWEIFWLV